MSVPTDEYIDIWLEQVERERARIPAGRTQVDFDTWHSMLSELKRRRAADLDEEERDALRWPLRLAEYMHCEDGRDVQITAVETLRRLIGGRR